MNFRLTQEQNMLGQDIPEGLPMELSRRGKEVEVAFGDDDLNSEIVAHEVGLSK